MNLAMIALSIASLALQQQSPALEHSFDEPIDALSVTFTSKDDTASVSARRSDGSWTDVATLHVEDEQDPDLFESNLVMFPEHVTKIRIKGATDVIFHPIRVSDEASHVLVASLNPSVQPHIISRTEWGANEDFLFDVAPAMNTDEAGDNGDTTPPPTTGGAVSARVQKCLDDQKAAPEDFKTVRTVTTQDGKTLRWADKYSKKIKLLVVHHTAVTVSGDDRSGAERMRALYAYHANNRGWGDIGYHYVIDDQGQIYEGKSGGDFVVAGHAYCNNVGTIGISMMGNFDEEEPTQKQIQSLQWLLSTLSTRYDIDVDGTVQFHGRTMKTIVGHRDLLSTDCPGFYAYGVLDQVREHVAEADLTALVTFPKKPVISKKPHVDSAEERKAKRLEKLPPKSAFTEGLSPTGGSEISGRAGAQILFSLRYQAGPAGAKKGQNAGAIVRGADDIGLWIEKDDAFLRVRNSIELPQAVPSDGQLLLRMRVQLPRAEGSYNLQIGTSRLTLHVTGRSLESKGQPAIRQTASRSSARSVASVVSRSSRSPVPLVSPVSFSSVPPQSSLIRIRLKSREAGLQSCRDVDYTALLDLYRGSINCVTVDGAPALINTLTLEEYMMGLAEEPDTEPFEKQRAFAIAARTYALYYTDQSHRKFPGKPYDGNDSPAEFQKYSGKSFEKDNPRWVVAVSNTHEQVLTKDGDVIKPPYFSSDDGRTKNPDDVGWTTFPFKEIFSSKPDPWCKGMENRGHGVGMSGCGAEGQANEGKKAEEILLYYYPGTTLRLSNEL